MAKFAAVGTRLLHLRLDPGLCFAFSVDTDNNICFQRFFSQVLNFKATDLIYLLNLFSSNFSVFVFVTQKLKGRDRDLIHIIVADMPQGLNEGLLINIDVLQCRGGWGKSGLRGKSRRKLIIRHCACVAYWSIYTGRHLSAASNDVRIFEWTCFSL